jgi:hypothetical protein
MAATTVTGYCMKCCKTGVECNDPQVACLVPRGFKAELVAQTQGLLATKNMNAGDAGGL